MPYTIYKSDGTPVTVNDNVISTQFYDPAGGDAGNGQGVQLVGRNAINYGAPIAQNFLQLTENFSSNDRPSGQAGLQGMLWFNKSSSTLFVKTGTGDTDGDWRRIPVMNPTGTPQNGDIQVITTPTVSISIYADGAWRQVFPAVYS